MTYAALLRKVILAISVPFAINGFAIFIALADDRLASVMDTRLDRALQVLLGTTLIAPLILTMLAWFPSRHRSR